MINSEKHKKLLAQVAELEKNSVNYFDVEKEFFLIDSNNLSQVRPKLYGYSIQATGIYEDDNLTPEAVAGLDGRGCYIYVEVKGEQITIKQDLNGCWGIYLFRRGDYFALSNSFFRLVDHVKFKYPLTVNRDYVNFFLVCGLGSVAYSETPLNEIEIIVRNAILHIDKTKKNLEIERLDYKEYSIALDSSEAIDVIDHWVEFWGDILCNIAHQTKFLRADLSGGFDSRISLIPLLHKRLNYNEVQIASRKGTVHTYAEDYEIASQIATHYGLKLNQPFPKNQSLNYSLTDIFNINLYYRQTIHKWPGIYNIQKTVEKIYSLNGYEGEAIRNSWFRTPQKFVEAHRWMVKPYSIKLSNELFHSVETILYGSLSAVRDNYKIEDMNSEEIAHHILHETQSRNHFGKDTLEAYFMNKICLSPIIDPELRTLKIYTAECPDPNLLVALIFIRYAPDLLTFPFNNNRSIAPETIEYAKRLNEHFQIYHKKADNSTGGGGQAFHLQQRDKKVEQIISLGQNNKPLQTDMLVNLIKGLFYSNRVYGLFTSYFDSEIYNYASFYYENSNYGALRHMYSVLGITKVLEDVEISQCNRPKYDGMKHFLEEDLAVVPANDIHIPNKFKPYITARILIQLMSTVGDIQILSEDKIQISKPEWLQKKGIGYMLTSFEGKLTFIAKVTVNGQILLQIGSLDIRDPSDKSKNIPYWIDYTKLIVNDNVIFDNLTPARCGKPYNYSIDVKADEEIKIEVEWLPHRSDT